MIIKIKKVLCKLHLHKWVYRLTYKQEYKLRFCKVCFKRQVPVKDWYVGKITWQDKKLEKYEENTKLNG